MFTCGHDPGLAMFLAESRLVAQDTDDDLLSNFIAAKMAVVTLWAVSLAVLA